MTTEAKTKGAEELYEKLSEIEYESEEYKEAKKIIRELRKLLTQL